MFSCVVACLRRRLGLFLTSIVLGAILALGFAFVIGVALTGGVAALVLLAGAIGGAAVTIAACANECRNRA
jgi:hypothetical protein